MNRDRQNSQEGQPLLAPASVNTDVDIEVKATGHKKTSFFETFVNFLKGNIGAGFLSLPFAFANGGYIGGPLVLVLLGIVTIYCMLMLVKSKDYLCRQKGIGFLSYAEVVTDAMGSVAPYVINTALLITQLGFVCVYILFFAQHLNEVVSDLTVTEYALIILGPTIMLSWLKEWKTVALPSAFATLCLIYAILVIFYYTIGHISGGVPADPSCSSNSTNTNDGDSFESLSLDVSNTTSTPSSCILTSKAVPFAAASSFPLLFGNSMYAFESIGLVLPLENSMAKRSQFPIVVVTGLTFVILLYATFGEVGYIVFGDAVEGSITLNLPNSALFVSVKIVMSIALWLTIPVQFFPAIRIIESWYMPSLKSSTPWKRTIVQNFGRGVTITVCTGIAIGVPQLGLMISLVGSTGAVLLAVIAPPLVHFLLFRKTQSIFVSILDVFIVIIGIGGSVAGTYTALRAIIDAF